MSVQNHNSSYQCRVTMNEKIDMLFGFLTGAISMGIVALVVGITFLETNGITYPALFLAVFALITLLLLRGVPIDEVSLGDFLTIEFTMQEKHERGHDNSQTDKAE